MLQSSWGYFTHMSILAKTLVGLNIELGYGYKTVFFFKFA